MKVLTFGELLLRLAAPGYTKLFQKETMEATFCGGEANVAVSLANFGINVEFLSVLPNNEIGVSAMNSLRYFGVDTSRVKFGKGRMGMYYLEKGVSQRPSKVIYDREYSAIAIAASEEFDWENIFAGIDWFHLTGITPALSEELALTCKAACKIAKLKGITVSCDLNYRGSLWSPEKANRVMTTIMPYVDVCVGNEEDADKVLGIKAENTDVESGILNKKGYEAVACKISSQFDCKKVAITLRESYSASRNGWSAMLYDGEAKQSFYSKQYDIQIVDRVGGGDSFTAGLIYGLISGKNNQDVIDFATAASCLKHTMEGDFNRTSVYDVERLLMSGGNGRVQR